MQATESYSMRHLSWSPVSLPSSPVGVTIVILRVRGEVQALNPNNQSKSVVRRHLAIASPEQRQLGATGVVQFISGQSRGGAVGDAQTVTDVEMVSLTPRSRHRRSGRVTEWCRGRITDVEVAPLTPRSRQWRRCRVTDAEVASPTSKSRKWRRGSVTASLTSRSSHWRRYVFSSVLCFYSLKRI